MQRRHRSWPLASPQATTHCAVQSSPPAPQHTTNPATTKPHLLCRLQAAAHEVDQLAEGGAHHPRKDGAHYGAGAPPLPVFARHLRRGMAAGGVHSVKAGRQSVQHSAGAAEQLQPPNSDAHHQPAWQQQASQPAQPAQPAQEARAAHPQDCVQQVKVRHTLVCRRLPLHVLQHAVHHLLARAQLACEREAGRRRGRVSCCRASADAPQVCTGCLLCADAAVDASGWRATRRRWRACRASAACTAARRAATADGVHTLGCCPLALHAWQLRFACLAAGQAPAGLGATS